MQYADEYSEVPMLVDSNHLSNEASALLVRSWVENGLLPDVASARSGQRKPLETSALWEVSRSSFQDASSIKVR
jgi:hypothetical protein